MKFENCKYNHLDLSEKFLEMAEKFLPYAKDESNHVNMMAGKTEVHACGTVACHGGYAGLALNSDSEFFDVGANALANFLGLGDMENMRQWARTNEKIWGGYGGAMFSSRVAFGVPINERITMVHIVQKYLDVAKRLMEIES